MGLNQPLIGSFTIPIGELIYNLKKEREEETAAIKYIVDELDKILKGVGVTSYNIQNTNTNTIEEGISESPL